MEEIWKDIPGYEGLYLINPNGEILSLRSGKVRKSTNSGNGYRKISLSGIDHKKSQFLIHRLVTMVFLPNPFDDSAEVNHKNLDKTDNRVENLEWSTHADNMEHAYVNNRIDFHRKRRRDNTSGHKGIEKRGDSYCVTITYRGVRHYLGRYKSMAEAIEARKTAERRLENEDYIL